MSTLRVSTIQDTAGSNSSTPAAIANGIAKAWVNFNGTGVVAIRAQYNVSSITDNGTGDYTVNFTTAIVDANYATVTNCAEDYTSNTAGFIATSRARFSPTTSACRVVTFVSSNGTRFDVVEYNVAIFR